MPIRFFSCHRNIQKTLIEPYDIHGWTSGEKSPAQRYRIQDAHLLVLLGHSCLLCLPILLFHVISRMSTSYFPFLALCCAIFTDDNRNLPMANAKLGSDIPVCSFLSFRSNNRLTHIFGRFFCCNYIS